MNKKNEIRLRKIRQILVYTGLALFMVGGAVLSTPGYGRTPLVKPEAVLPQHYPDGFHDYGLIDAIGPGFVVINDTGYKLSPNVTYNTPAIANASMAYFRAGVLAGFLKNARNEVVSLWLIE